MSTGGDKLKLLADTLERAGLQEVLGRRCAELGCAPAALKVVIKPNFMFMYSEQDRFDLHRSRAGRGTNSGRVAVRGAWRSMKPATAAVNAVCSSVSASGT